MDVQYIPYGPGKGGKIRNSYLITDPAEMREYAEYVLTHSPYKDAYLGTVDAFVYEWEIHNYLHAAGTLVGNQGWIRSGMDFDFGATIFDDNHGWISVLMWRIYENGNKRDYDINVMIHFGIME